MRYLPRSLSTQDFSLLVAVISVQRKKQPNLPNPLAPFFDRGFNRNSHLIAR